MPRACPCCDGEPDAELEVSFTRRSGKRVVREHTRSWSFPYCGRCVAHVKAWESAGTMAVATLAVGIAAGVVLGFASGTSALGVGVFAFSLPIALILAMRQRVVARKRCVPACASAGASVGYLGWDGSVQGFAFAADGYAVSFARANGRSLINVSPELRRLIETAAEPSIRVEVSPAAPPRAARVPAPVPASTRNDGVLEWIARIESYKGPVARRNALKRVVEEIADPEARRALVLAASKIETAAVLNKVDTLTTIPAKRRHLEKAIAELRADDIPDDLQAEELSTLEAALRSLGQG